MSSRPSLQAAVFRVGAPKYSVEPVVPFAKFEGVDDWDHYFPPYGTPLVTFRALGAVHGFDRPVMDRLGLNEAASALFGIELWGPVLVFSAGKGGCFTDIDQEKLDKAIQTQQ